MKKLVATAVAGLMLCGVSAGLTTPVEAASYSVHITSGPSRCPRGTTRPSSAER